MAQELLDHGVDTGLQLVGHNMGTLVVVVAVCELGWVDQLTPFDPVLTPDGSVYGVTPSEKYAGEVENYWAASPTRLSAPMELEGIFNREMTETPRTKIPPTIIDLLPEPRQCDASLPGHHPR